MKKLPKKIWNKILASGSRGIIAGICFAIALSVSVYFASAHFIKPASTQNEQTSNEEVLSDTPTTIEKTSSVSCNEELKQQALNTENTAYNAKVEAENTRKQKALDVLKATRDEKIAEMGQPSSNPELTALMREQSQKTSVLYGQKNSELARLSHDSEGRIISTEQENQINAKYDPLIKAINDEYSEKRRVLTSQYQQLVKDIYEQEKKGSYDIAQESNVALARLQSDHEEKISQINNTCY